MADDSVALGEQALAAGRWDDARAAFEAALLVQDSPEAHIGLATALWWLGGSRAGVREAERAYVLFRSRGDLAGAVRCAVWLSFIYHGDFANHAAANGWVRRAATLLDARDHSPLHGWVDLARASLMTDLPAAEGLTETAIRLARDGQDADLELSALAQLGRIRIGLGDLAGGFALIDEAMAAALAGESSTLDTVANAGCDMLNACELANDIERAEQWCRVTEDFVQRFGCPYLYAECRIYYGSVLVAKGRWADAEQELTTGIRVTKDVSPGLHSRARTRLAGLRIRQGRLEEADQLLAIVGPDTDSEIESLLCLAALQLARNDPLAARRTLTRTRQRVAGHRTHLGTTLAQLVEASVEIGDHDGAASASDELTEAAAGTEVAVIRALAAGARGRVSAAAADSEAAVAELRTAHAIWAQLHQPFEAAKTLAEIGKVLAAIADPSAADCFRNALTGFRELGALLEADRVARQLRSLGIPVRPTKGAPGVVSERENQVLRLVAAGLSNPEIAARLHVSRKTVSHHVSHLLTKLSLRNRAELAAYVAREQGQPDESVAHSQK